MILNCCHPVAARRYDQFTQLEIRTIWYLNPYLAIDILLLIVIELLVKVHEDMILKCT